MTRIYLLRHGLARGGEGRAVGQLDLPLSEGGAEQIRHLARTWHGPAPDRLFTSDLRRARESAGILAERFATVPTVDARLRELSFGAWEGQRWDEIHRRDRHHLAAWADRWWAVAPPGGETFARLCRRVAAWFRELGDDGVVVAVLHAGSLRALLAEVVHTPRAALFDIRLDCGRVSAVAGDRRGYELVSVNRRRF